MEEFLKDYVKMLAEVRGHKLNRKKLTEIINNLMEDDNLWEPFDDYIVEIIERSDK